MFDRFLEAILFAYAFTVSGHFVPTLAAFFWRGATSAGAFWAMIAGGASTLLLKRDVVSLPRGLARVGLDPTAYGIALSAVVFVAVSRLGPRRPPSQDVTR